MTSYLLRGKGNVLGLCPIQLQASQGGAASNEYQAGCVDVCDPSISCTPPFLFCILLPDLIQKLGFWRLIACWAQLDIAMEIIVILLPEVFADGPCRSLCATVASSLLLPYPAGS